MQRINHQNPADLLAMARAEDAGVEGSHASTDEQPRSFFTGPRECLTKYVGGRADRKRRGGSVTLVAAVSECFKIVRCHIALPMPRRVDRRSSTCR